MKTRCAIAGLILTGTLGLSACTITPAYAPYSYYDPPVHTAVTISPPPLMFYWGSGSWRHAPPPRWHGGPPRHRW